ncbi:hypothetical protein FA13DRAFT_1785860 [Coprinellus micaceus]|uniref:RlpA-like protein double-psi beta-barrel domain-containing protein n=1 Tax=Coprinellus micaceus TaxID=71717 RepID=A0A4Y7TV11_COPMI|nr:hypothetical protein FA13DRAFT_1785860 [Coprinellus micaceus]
MRYQALGLLAPTGCAVGVAIRSLGEAPVKRAEWITESKWTPYDVGTGYTGACGRFIYSSEFGVAISTEVRFPIQPSLTSNPNRVQDFQPALCNRIVALKSGGKSAYSQILDVCRNCAKGDLNVTQHLFNFFSSDASTPIVGEWQLAND